MLLVTFLFGMFYVSVMALCYLSGKPLYDELSGLSIDQALLCLFVYICVVIVWLLFKLVNVLKVKFYAGENVVRFIEDYIASLLGI